jgi:hypothetical protein
LMMDNAQHRHNLKHDVPADPFSFKVA